MRSYFYWEANYFEEIKHSSRSPVGEGTKGFEGRPTKTKTKTKNTEKSSDFSNYSINISLDFRLCNFFLLCEYHTKGEDSVFAKNWGYLKAWLENEHKFS